MRKPIIFKDHCDDELPWACCYEDDKSNVEWSEGRFYIGFGKTAVEAYHNWTSKQALEELKKWHDYSDYEKLVEYTQKLPTSFIKVLDDNFWELVLK